MTDHDDTNPINNGSATSAADDNGLVEDRLRRTLTGVASQTDIADSDAGAGVAVLAPSSSSHDGASLRRWARPALAAAAVLVLTIGGLAFARTDGGGDTIETATSGAGAGSSGLPRYLPGWLPDGYGLAEFHETNAPRSSELVWANADGNQLTLKISDLPVVSDPGDANATQSAPAAGAPDTPVCFPEPCWSGPGDAASPGSPASPPTDPDMATIADMVTIDGIEGTVEITNAGGTALVWERDGYQFRLTSTFLSTVAILGPAELTPYGPDGDPSTDDAPRFAGGSTVPGSTGSEATSGSVPSQAPDVPAVIGDEPAPNATSTSSTNPALVLPNPALVMPDGGEVEARTVEPGNATGVVIDPPSANSSMPGSTIGPAGTVAPPTKGFTDAIDPSLPSTTPGLPTLDEFVTIGENLREVIEEEFDAYVAGVAEPTAFPPEIELVPDFPEDSPATVPPASIAPVPPIAVPADPGDAATGPTTTVPPITLPLDQLDIVCMLLSSVVSPDLDERVNPQPALDLYDALVQSLLVDQPGAADDMEAYRDGVLALIAVSPDGLVSQSDLIELSLEINDC